MYGERIDVAPPPRFVKLIRRPYTLCLALSMAVMAGVLVAEERPGTATDEPSGLKIVKSDILYSEGGYSIPSESIFFPGETVYLRFEVDGYTRGEYDRVKLSWRIDSFGPGGDAFAMAEAGSIDSELAPQDKDWRPIIRHAPTIPAHAEAGGYQITLEVVGHVREVLPGPQHEDDAGQNQRATLLRRDAVVRGGLVGA